MVKSVAVGLVCGSRVVVVRRSWHSLSGVDPGVDPVGRLFGVAPAVYSAGRLSGVARGVDDAAAHAGEVTGLSGNRSWAVVSSPNSTENCLSTKLQFPPTGPESKAQKTNL